MLCATPNIHIPESELVERFIQAGGPGGQHVNKTDTAVQLRFRIASSTSLPPDVQNRLMDMAANRINQDGELLIEARRHRSQHRNRESAREQLGELIALAAQPPKRRKPTRPSRAAKARGVRKKKQHSHTKQLRGRPRRDD